MDHRRHGARSGAIFFPSISKRTLAANGIDGCIAVQADQSLDETRFLLDLAHGIPSSRASSAGWTCGRRDSTRRSTTLAHDPRLRGIRHVAQAEPDDFLARDDVIRGIGRLGRARTHLRHPDLRAATAGRAHADLTAAGSGLSCSITSAKPRIKEGRLEPWATRAEGTRPAAECLLQDLRARDRSRLDRLASGSTFGRILTSPSTRSGADRVMFGSDWPVCLSPRRTSACWASSTSTRPRSRRTSATAFFGGNAARFYGLTMNGSRSDRQGRPRHRRRQGHRRGDRACDRGRRRACRSSSIAMPPPRVRLARELHGVGRARGNRRRRADRRLRSAGRPSTRRSRARTGSTPSSTTPA